jgi:response regulator of citrate/malate metabolism
MSFAKALSNDEIACFHILKYSLSTHKNLSEKEIIKTSNYLCSFVFDKNLPVYWQIIEIVKMRIIRQDYLPGEKSGLDFVAELKRPKSKWKDLPIFIVSNTASNGNVRSYLRLGVTKYCVKADNRLDQIIKDLTEFLDNPKK